MPSWAALQERARLVRGETVLINGATGTSGRLAVQVAKHLGAKKVIATGRNPGGAVRPGCRSHGVTHAVAQCRPGHAERAGVDVVLDYLWGESAETLLVAAAKAAPEAVPIRFVGVGSVSAPAITLPSAALRSSALELMGSGVNRVPLPRLLRAVAEPLAAAATAGFEIATRAVPLARVADHWANLDSARRAVFTTGPGATA